MSGHAVLCTPQQCFSKGACNVCHRVCNHAAQAVMVDACIILSLAWDKHQGCGQLQVDNEKA